MQFSKRMDRFGDEIFASLNDKKIEMEKQGRTFYNLSVGTPDFPVAEHIRAALIESAKDPDSWKYTLRDTPELLSAVCSYYKKRYDVDIAPDQVVSCSGSEEGVGLIGLALCDDGDTVLIPTPCYPVFLACAAMAGAKPYYYPMHEENGFLPDVRSIPEQVAREAKFMPVQQAAIAALTGPADGLIPQCERYKARRDALCGGLREIGWEVRDSKGSMFVWAPLPAGYDSSMEFCMKLMEEAGVICTPGVSFGPLGEGYVRFALTLPEEKICEAVEAIRQSGLLGR